VLDDLHKPEYGSFARRRLRSLGVPHFSARAWTLDRDGRYALVALPPRR
jgi:hypothetical protein